VSLLSVTSIFPARYAALVVDHLKRGAERVGERMDAARETMGERVDAARDAAAERAGAAREAVGEKATAAKDAAAEAIAAVKPRLRGVSHEWAFFISLGLGVALIAAADSPRATLAMAIYAVSLSALLGTSALYHRVNWRRPRVRQWMRRLDHSMIFLLIAGTYTPFALLVLDGAMADTILAAVWIGAIAGSVVEMIWINHPKWVAALIYMSLGWVAIIAFPQMWDAMGLAGMLLIAAGGLLYTAGAVVYATQRPNPNPAVFGYHEIFHLFVIAAAAFHFAAVAIYALPA
jgi:hemolysin III